MIKFTLSWL